MTESYAITGIPMPAKPDPHHPIPLRKEVTAWANDPDNAVQLSLFIQALLKFQAMDYRDKLSYFQVAGIHGYPATSWDGAETPNPGDTGSSWYCNHNKTTFPTWHRPYMLLFEQRLYEIMMQEIVSKVEPESERAIWEIEASHWRLPYWDWAADQPYLQNVGIPHIFTLERITVLMPNHKSQNFPNPLWKFTNPAGNGDVPMGDKSMRPWVISPQPWNIAIGTSRHGILNRNTQAQWIKGVNNFTNANRAIQAHNWDFGDPSYAISDLVSRLMSDDYLKSWRTFSSTLHSQEGGAPSPTDFLSLEEIHNNIHGFTGGSDPNSDGLGHMTDPGVASFDPIFFLHHCNVDRQLAMWQTLNPDKWFDNLDDSDTGPDAKLAPFHKDQKFTLYDSNDIRDWTALNYQYDILENTPRWIRVQGTNVTRDHIANHVRRTVNMHLNKSRQAVLASPQLSGKENDYIINVVYDRYALAGRPYSLHFFLGATPDALPEGTIYQDLPSYIGTVFTFSSSLELSGEGKCESCVRQRDAKVLSKAQVILTTRLIDHCHNPNIPELNTMQPEDVERYLTKNLTWKAVEALTGASVPIQELPRTKVYVLAGKAQHSEDPGQMSRYGDYGHLWAPTQGKAGGAAPPDQGAHMDL